LTTVTQAVASCGYAGVTCPGKRKENEVRELHCTCGNRLVAEDDEQLVR
jgi:hypothetical protein